MIFTTKAGNMDILKLLLDKDITFLTRENDEGVRHDNFLSRQLKLKTDYLQSFAF